MIRVELPFHLRTLARIETPEIQIELDGPATLRSVIDAIETRYPVLRGTIRDHVTLQRRPLVRFFACEQDLSHEPPDTPLPEPVAKGAEPFVILGAIAGGSPDYALPREPVACEGLSAVAPVWRNSASKHPFQVSHE